MHNDKFAASAPGSAQRAVCVLARGNEACSGLVREDDPALVYAWVRVPEIRLLHAYAADETAVHAVRRSRHTCWCRAARLSLLGKRRGRSLGYVDVTVEALNRVAGAFLE